jgi:hypothetical protein
LEKVMFWTPDAVAARADGSQRLAASWRFLLRFLVDLSRAAAGSATKSPAAKSRPATRVARRVMASEMGRIFAPAYFIHVGRSTLLVGN